MSANQNNTVCDYNEFRRPRYFHGMLLDDKDFLAEQGYHAGKRRLLNRTLHGSGVVCGLDLNGKRGGQAIEVTPGLALDCCGNEIWVRNAVALDLAKLLPPKDTSKDKKECKEEDDSGKKPKSYYLGIRYEEKASDPVSVYLPGAGCEERTCEYSRYKEGFCLEIVECCRKKPETGILKDFCDCKEGCEPEKKKTSDCWDCEGLTGMELCRCIRLEEFCEQSVPCPDCCSSCCHPCHVILGRIDVDEKGCIVEICINDCREYVITGPMVKHLIVSIFAGLEKDIFELTVGEQEQPMPEIESLAANPIKALCWYLRNFVVEKGSLTPVTCRDIFAKPQTPTREEHDQVARHQKEMQGQLATLTKKSQAFVSEEEFEKLSTAHKQLSGEQKKLIESLTELERIVKKPPPG